MPVPTASTSHQREDLPIFPALTIDQVDAARLSRWYDKFEDLTIPSTVIDLDSIGEKALFLEWIDSESIFIPVEDDQDRSRRDGTEEGGSTYRLPVLGKGIRETIERYSGGGIFPKLNWSAPRDAAFLLPQTTHGPLHCSSPHDVYLLLKSSDFVTHSLDPARAYEGCVRSDSRVDESAVSGSHSSAPFLPTRERMAVEIVLRRWENINPSREFRCFVRDDMLIGVSVRDFNFYPHFQDEGARERVCETIRSFWEDEIRGDFDGGSDYVFDIVLDDLHSSARLVDFNPYNASTDPLLFTYPELHEILLQALEPVPTSTSPENTTDARPRLPILRVIDSQAHPEANRGMPAFGTNMMPVEMVEMSQGRGVGEFKAAWEDAVAEGMRNDDSSSDSDSQ